MAFDLSDDGRIVVSRVEAGHEDPAIGAFLGLLASEIQSGRNIRELPEDLIRAMLNSIDQPLKPDEVIEGDVVI